MIIYREVTVKVNFYDEVEDELLKFAVIVVVYQNKLVFCKHRQRETFEIPGGHRENNETILACAKRELYEETGALEYFIEPICVYSIIGKNRVNDSGEEMFGMLFFADVQVFEKNLYSEIEKIYLFDNLPERWTYPKIQPILLKEVLKRKNM